MIQGFILLAATCVATQAMPYGTRSLQLILRHFTPKRSLFIGAAAPSAYFSYQKFFSPKPTPYKTNSLWSTELLDRANYFIGPDERKKGPLTHEEIQSRSIIAINHFTQAHPQQIVDIDSSGTLTQSRQRAISVEQKLHTEYWQNCWEKMSKKPTEPCSCIAAWGDAIVWHAEQNKNRNPDTAIITGHLISSIFDK